MPAPTITSIYPFSGTPFGGTLVTITGTDLSQVTGVAFGDNNYATDVSASSTKITCTSPAQQNDSSPVYVQLFYGFGHESDTLAQYYYNPIISEVNPPSGSIEGGTQR